MRGWEPKPGIAIRDREIREPGRMRPGSLRSDGVEDRFLSLLMSVFVL